MLHAKPLAHRRPTAGAVVPVTVISLLGIDTGLISHLSVGSFHYIPHSEVKDIRLTDLRDMRNSHIIADLLLLQVFKHSA